MLKCRDLFATLQAVNFMYQSLSKDSDRQMPDGTKLYVIEQYMDELYASVMPPFTSWQLLTCEI